MIGGTLLQLILFHNPVVYILEKCVISYLIIFIKWYVSVHFGNSLLIWSYTQLEFILDEQDLTGGNIGNGNKNKFK